MHGPPGTGKSTTISKIIKYRIPRDEKVLATSTRNKAIDSMCEKFEKDKISCIVVGNTLRMGPVAASYTLENQMKRHDYVSDAKKKAEEVSKALKHAEKSVRKILEEY